MTTTIERMLAGTPATSVDIPASLRIRLEEPHDTAGVSGARTRKAQYHKHGKFLLYNSSCASRKLVSRSPVPAALDCALLLCLAHGLTQGPCSRRSFREKPLFQPSRPPQSLRSQSRLEPRRHYKWNHLLSIPSMAQNPTSSNHIHIHTLPVPLTTSHLHLAQT